MRIWLAAYLAIMLIGAAVFGDVWLERADPFEVYSNLLAKLSVWGRATGRSSSVMRSPLANLATVTPRPGLVAVVAVLFGSTAFDSYKDTIAVAAVRAATWAPTRSFTNSVALLVVLPRGRGHVHRGRDVDRRGDAPARTPYAARALPNLLAHSVIPIIVGYMTAHYLSYLVEQGQSTIIQLSDPMVRGDNLLGTANCR